MTEREVKRKILDEKERVAKDRFETRKSIEDGTPVGAYDPRKPRRYWDDSAGRILKQPDVPNPSMVNSERYRANFDGIDWSR